MTSMLGDRIQTNRSDLSKIKASKLIYNKRSCIDLSNMNKKLTRNVFVHNKTLTNMSDVSIRPSSNLYKLLKDQRTLNLSDDESAIKPIKHYKVLRALKTDKMPLSTCNVKALVRVMNICNRALKDLTVWFTNFQSLTSDECERIHLIVCNGLNKLLRLSRLELVLALHTEEILLKIADALKIYKKLTVLNLIFPHINIERKAWLPISIALKAQENMQDLILSLSIAENVESYADYFDFLYSLKKLQKLSLNIRQKKLQNIFGFTDNQALEFPQLESLNLKLFSNQPNNQPVLDLLPNINASNLFDLNLSVFRVNDLSGKCFKRLTERIKTFGLLKSLVFEVKLCFLADESFVVGGDLFVSNLQTLKLTFKNQQLSPDNFSALLRNFNRMDLLKELYIDFSLTGMSCNSLEVISKSLGELKSLEDLYLEIGSNSIKDKGLKALAEKLADLRNLRKVKLELSENQFTSAALQILVETLGTLSKLESLSINIKYCQFISALQRDKIVPKLKEMLPNLIEGKTLTVQPFTLNKASRF